MTKREEWDQNKEEECEEERNNMLQRPAGQRLLPELKHNSKQFVQQVQKGLMFSKTMSLTDGDKSESVSTSDCGW